MRPNPANMKIVAISDLIISDCENDVIATYSLGSCVGVTLYDPVRRIGGMIHCMLPVSSNNTEKANNNPYMFVDTGLVKMIQQLLDSGARLENLICKVAGAGNPMDDQGRFRIGERNYAVLKKILWKNNILIKGENVGGKTAKTMFLHIKNGITIIKLNGKEEIEI